MHRHIYADACILIPIHTHTDACIHTHTNTHTHKPTHKHTHRCTDTQNGVSKERAGGEREKRGRERGGGRGGGQVCHR